MTDQTNETTKHKRCPFCRKRKGLVVEHWDYEYWVLCIGCRVTGPFGNTPAEAWEKWDARPKRKRKKAKRMGYPVTALRGLLAALNVATHNCMADTDEIHAANMADLLSQALQHHPEGMVANWLTSQINQVEEGAYR